MQQLRQAWRTLNATTSHRAGGQWGPHNAAAMATFAGQVGAIAMPPNDQSDQDAVIHAAVTLEGDYQSSRYQASSGASDCSGGLSQICLPPMKAYEDVPSRYSGDVTRFNDAVGVLFSDLGVPGP